MSAATRNPYRVPNGYIPNPFDPLYQNNDVEPSEDLSVQFILDYANELDNKITGDFDLGGVINEIKNNTLSFVRTGLLAYKVKVLKLWRDGYRTFKDFCEKAIGITHWQVNRMIEAARVVIELAQDGFDVLPKNEAQARPLTKFTGDDLCANWQTILDTTKEYKITGSKIAETLGMNVTSKSLRLPPDLYYQIQKRAFEAGVSVEEILRMVFGEEYQTQEPDEQKLQAWQEDLDTLVADQDSDEELKSEPIGKVSEQPLTEETPAEPDDVLTSEPLTEQTISEALTNEDYLQDDEPVPNQNPVLNQHPRTSATQKSSSSNQASTSVSTEDSPKSSDSQGQPLPAKKSSKIFLDFTKPSGKKKRSKRGFGR